MKYLIIPILLICLTALNFVSEDFFVPRDIESNLNSLSVNNLTNFSKAENSKRTPKSVPTKYNCNIEFEPSKNITIVKSRIVWKNLTDFPAGKLYFNFSRSFNNADNDNTFNDSRINISKFVSSREASKLLFIKENSDNSQQSLAKIKFTKPLLKGDSVILFINYSFNITSNEDSTDNVTFIDDEWYPRIPVFENGKWQLFPYSRYTREYRSFADFNIEISAPEKIEFITTGNIVEQRENNGRKYLNIKQLEVKDFVIIAFNNSHVSKSKYKTSDFILNIYTSDKNRNYINRIKSAASNSKSYLNNIGNYPYDDLSIIYLPNAEKLKRTTFSKTIIVSTDIFSSGDSYSFEELIGQYMSEQYFHFVVSNNPQTEAWLSDGISKYIAEKIKLKYYAEDKASFKFLKYVSVNGLQFISYKGIPLVYTLGDYSIPQEATSLKDYYEGYPSGSIADVSYSFNDSKSFKINSVDKPFLLLLSLERIIGKEKLNKILNEYYNNYKFTTSNGKDFFRVINKTGAAATLEYLNQVYKGYDNYDLKILNIEKNKNTYKLFVESTGHCKLTTDIKVYTVDDTLSFKWNTTEKWKIFKFKSNSEVVAAEIDPAHKYIFDPNYSNNSYTIKRMNWASISISIRWFFWIQNALMILGSVA